MDIGGISVNATDPMIYEELKRLTDELHAAWKQERATRLSLLRLHALMGILVGTLIITTGAASKAEADFGLWVRPMLGGLALASGAVLLLGIRRLDTNYRLECLGLILMGLWDTLMAVVITGVMFTYRGPWVLPGAHLVPSMPDAQPRPYAVVVYLALALMVWGVHLRAVLADRRRRRV